MITYVTGDLFDNVYMVTAFAHGCNCQGVMGAGIAKEFKKRYPKMFEEYRRLCRMQPRQFNLGDSFFWRTQDKPSVFNLGTQESYGKSASYEAIRKALSNMRQQADAENITKIAVPRIGSGFGKLSWVKVREIIENVFENWIGTLYVYDQYTSSNQQSE